MTRQEKLDAFARKKGYPSYFKYRDAQAKAAGFKSYSDFRRKSRRPGSGVTEITKRPAGLRPPPPTILQRVAAIQDRPRRLRLSYRETAGTTTEIAVRMARITDTRLKTSANADAAVRTINGMISQLDEQAKDYFGHDFPSLFMEGARSANPNFKPGLEDAKAIKPIGDRGLRDLLDANQHARRVAPKTIHDILKAGETEGLAKATSKPFTGKVYKNGARYSFESYADIVLDATAARAYNTGTIRGGISAGVSIFEVVDGEKCGWTSHADPEKAHGKLVTADEALAFPIAHPHCVRQFIPRPDLDEGDPDLKRSMASRVASFAKSSAKSTAKASALNIAIHLASDVRVRQAAAKVALSTSQEFQRYKTNVERLVALYNYARRTQVASLGNVTDLATRMPAEASVGSMIKDVTSYIDDFMAGEEVPAHVRYIMGVEEQAERKVVGDRFERFVEFSDKWTEANPPSVGDYVTHLVKTDIADSFYGWLGPITSQGKFMRMTFPDIGGVGGGIGERPIRITADLKNLARVSTTSIKNRGLVNHVNLNPNGLLRFGFTKDPETKFITPTFRIVPPGPLHISTRMNRGVKGNITSLSGEVGLLTRAPLVHGVSLKFNLNLRKLGLTNLKDIKDMDPLDLLKFDKEDLRMVSLFADLRIRGFNILEIAKTVRLPWEDAEKLWHLSNKYIGEQIQEELAAKYRRARFYVVRPGGQSPPKSSLRARLLPPPPSKAAVAKAKRTAEEIKIARSATLKELSARKIAATRQITTSERKRVSDMVKTLGVRNTIVEMRTVPQIFEGGSERIFTWAEIGARMNMSESQAKKIFQNSAHFEPPFRTVNTIRPKIRKPGVSLPKQKVPPKPFKPVVFKPNRPPIWVERKRPFPVEKPVAKPPADLRDLAQQRRRKYLGLGPKEQDRITQMVGARGVAGTIVHLRDQEGLEWDQIAARLHESEAVVKRLYEQRKKER